MSPVMGITIISYDAELVIDTLKKTRVDCRYAVASWLVMCPILKLIPPLVD
jgi:hypothetical protein